MEGAVTDDNKLIGIPDPGSPVKVPGRLISVTTSADGLMAIIAVQGGRIVVPYWAVDLSDRGESR